MNMLTALLLLVPSLAPASEILGGHPRVADADTLVVAGARGSRG